MDRRVPPRGELNREAGSVVPGRLSPSKVADPAHGVLRAAERLPPGSFALVMATGIVAIACQEQAIPVVPVALGAFNGVAWSALAVLTLLRIAWFTRPLIRDLSDHLRAPGFLTTAAGASVLGAQTLAIERAPSVAWALWLLSVLLWGLILYAFLIAMAIADRKPPLPAAINGGWLLATVATQSVVALGGALWNPGPPAPALQFALCALFLAGVMLYGLVMTLIFYRISFFPLSAEEFGPLYWIDAGAAAISALAGATLILRAPGWPILGAYLPFLRGATLSVWAAATFWLPFLVAMATWRYAMRRDRLRYEPGLWGMVFPVGMYSAATFSLARADGLPFLDPYRPGFRFCGSRRVVDRRRVLSGFAPSIDQGGRSRMRAGWSGERLRTPP